MNIFIILAILVTNLVAIGLIYQFIKRIGQKEKFIFIVGSVAIIYGLVSLVYWISGFGIDQTLHENSKNFIIYLFVPINAIILIPYIASGYSKLKLNKIKGETFKKRIIVMSILALIVLTIEFFYFKNIQININDIIKNNKANVNSTNTITNNTQNLNEQINNLNTIQTNQINNSISTNTQSDSESKRILTNFVQ